MSNQPTPNPSDQEALSAYLDGMLPEAERAVLEDRLQHEPTLRHELNALRQTVDLVRGLPTLKAPRDFTLTTDLLVQSNEETLSLLRRVRSIPRNVVRLPALSLVSAAASIALVLLGFILISSYLGDTINSQFSTISETFKGAESSDAAIAMAPTATLSPTMESNAAESGIAQSGPASDALTQRQQEPIELTTTAAAPALMMGAVDTGAVTAEAQTQALAPSQNTLTTEEPEVPFPFATGAFEANPPEADRFTIQATPAMEERAMVAPLPTGTFAVESTQIAQAAANQTEGELAAPAETLDDESAAAGAAITNEQPAPQGAGGRDGLTEQSQKAAESNETDLTAIGIILVAAGVLLALLTVLMRRLRNNH